MPLELGLFLGAKKFGGPKRAQKKSLVLDVHPHRYQAFISDIAGQDIHSRGETLGQLVGQVARWLRDEVRDPAVPGGSAIANEYAKFLDDVPKIAGLKKLKPEEITFKDFTAMAAEWIIAETGQTEPEKAARTRKHRRRKTRSR